MFQRLECSKLLGKALGIVGKNEIDAKLVFRP